MEPYKTTDSDTGRLIRWAGMALAMLGAALSTTGARAQVLAMTLEHSVGSIIQGVAPDVVPDEDSAAPTEAVTDIAARLRRQQVTYSHNRSGRHRRRRYF